MIRFDSAEQGTEAWRRARAGYASASRFADVLGTPTARLRYAEELVAARLTGDPGPEVSARSLAWGKGNEAFARSDYCMRTGDMVREVGFAHHASIAWVGASSDGLVVNQCGAIEVKSPHDMCVQHRTWRTGMPKEHKPQVQGGLWVLELEWIDFISFDPRYGPLLRLYVERIYRDDAYIAQLEAAIKPFLAQVNVMVQDTMEKARAKQ